MISIDKQISYWIETSDIDYKTAVDIFDSEKNFRYIKKPIKILLRLN